MLLTEQDLAAYQKCPRRLWFSKQHNTPEKWIDPPLLCYNRLAVWLWANKLRNNKTPGLKGLKAKWYRLVSSHFPSTKEWGTPAFLAEGFPIAREIYDDIVSSSIVPAAVAFPVRMPIEHIGTLRSVLDLVGVDEEEEKTLVNYSIESATKYVTTNMVNVGRFVAAMEQLEVTKIVNYRVKGSLQKDIIEVDSLDKDEYKKNLSIIMQGIQVGNSMPLPNCPVSCPWKERCK